MVAVPAPLIVTRPLVLLTVATPVLLDLKVTEPSVVFVSSFVNAASFVVLAMLAFANVSLAAALLIVNVALLVPV